MCRRQSGAALLTFARFPRAAVRFVSGEPAGHRSSARVERGFCARCGSPLTFAYADEPDVVWLTVGTLDHPERVRPTRHFMAEVRVPWVALAPRAPGTDGGLRLDASDGDGPSGGAE
jgi:hypothetical protein